MLDRLKAIIESQLARGFSGRAKSGPLRDLTHRNVVITGGGGGLGRAFARAFSTAGARISLIDLNQEALQEAQHHLSELGVRCQTVTSLKGSLKALGSGNVSFS